MGIHPKRPNLSMRGHDLTGRRFGRLIAVQKSTSRYKRAFWLCRCACGTMKPVATKELLRGRTQSCGCLLRDGYENTPNYSNGKYKSAEFSTWKKMCSRCLNPKDCNFTRYGGAGITVCKEWKLSFLSFLHDMGTRPKGTTSIDRIDNSKGYYKDNCRWATPKQQARNRGNNVTITFKGETRCIAEWSALLGISRYFVRKRMALK